MIGPEVEGEMLSDDSLLMRPLRPIPVGRLCTQSPVLSPLETAQSFTGIAVKGKTYPNALFIIR